jgi:cellulose synthase/poly-beta-1,6-N-acetylglucosamine synthase-like glycosyltransferase
MALSKTLASSSSTTDLPMQVYDYPEDPTVSVIVPCYNEERFIERCVMSIIEGDYPLDKLEILLVDGMSTDGTRDILKDLAARYPQVRMIDNERRIKPVALNLGIGQSKGEVLVRLDGHAFFPANYVKRLVWYLLTHDVANVGGVRRNLPRSDGFVARVLARLLTHPFGVGDASHYTGVSEPRYTNIVFLFCVRRSLFDEVGLFKEPLIRGQDREFNLRVAASGRKMLLVPDVHSNYFARDTLSGFFNWAMEGGATPFRINKYTDVNTVSFRNLIPPAFVLALLGSLVLGLIWSWFWWLSGAVLVSYFFVAAYAAAKIANQERNWRFLIAMPVAFFAWHFSYGLGAIKAVLEPLWVRREKGS